MRKQNEIVVGYIKSLQETSFSVAVSEEQEHIDNRVTYLFNQGLTQAEIALCLAITDNRHISERNLRRLMARLQLYRRRNLNESDVVINYIADQLRGPARLYGYQMMTERCRSEGLRVTRNFVYAVQSVLDPEGVQQRRARRLRRRHYSVPGPNYIWHMDSYNKLTAFGIGVNGCIDGFSWHIIWMQANVTNLRLLQLISSLLLVSGVVAQR